jgi:5-formyltetrahydrofolate cyclo-ligase
LNKAEFRKIAQKRLQITKRKRRVLSRKVEKELNKILLQKKPKTILFYYPLKNEVDILHSLKLWKKRRNILLPKIEKETFSVVPFRLPLKKSKFSTFEPTGKKSKRKIDIAIVPILGIDKSGRRIGFGKGMYDRFFAKLKYKPFTIFTQTILNYSKNIITEKHDIKKDKLIYGTHNIKSNF